MNIYRKAPNYSIKQDINPIYRTKNIYYSTNKIKQYISGNMIPNRNNKNKINNLRKPYYNTIIQSHDQKAYYKHYHNYNKNSNSNSGNEDSNIINTIKKSFVRLKNKINSLQKIMNTNSIYDKHNDKIKKQTNKSIDGINKSKNIFNNIYINIDNKDKKDYLYNHNSVNINNNNSIITNITYNPINNDYITLNSFNPINEKCNSSNNIIITQFKKKNNLNNNDNNELNENQKNKLLERMYSPFSQKIKYLQERNNQYNDNLFNTDYNFHKINNNLHIKVSKMTNSNDTENMSELANDLIKYVKKNNNNERKVNNNNYNDDNNNIIISNYYNNNPSLNDINKPKDIKYMGEMNESKENDLFFKSNISKIDEGINVKISLPSSLNNDDEHIVDKKKKIIIIIRI
jgi:hypothetical protein